MAVEALALEEVGRFARMDIHRTFINRVDDSKQRNAAR